MPIPAEHPVLTDGVVTLRAPRPDDVQGQIERNREGGRRNEEDARRWITFGITEAWARRERLIRQAVPPMLLWGCFHGLLLTQDMGRSRER